MPNTEDLHSEFLDEDRAIAFPRFDLCLLDEVQPPYLKGQCFVLFVAHYFAEWTEAVSLDGTTHNEVIEFSSEYIIYKFSNHKTLDADESTSFIICKVGGFAELYKPQ